MKNEDTRVQFTKARFHEALLTLLEQKPISQITAIELCNVAGLNRGTYYLHYSDPLDVLHEIEEEVLSETLYPDTEPDAEWNSSDWLTRQLTAVWEDRRRVSIIIGHNGDPSFLGRVRDRTFSLSHKSLKTLSPDQAEETFALRYDYLFSGCTGAVTSWLKGRWVGTPEKLAQKLSLLNESIVNINLSE